MGKILSFDFDAEVPEKRRGAKSAVDWLGTVKKFYELFLKTGKYTAQVKLGDTVTAGTAYSNLRDIVNDEKSEFKGKVEVVATRHKEKKRAERGKNKGMQIEATIIDNVFLRITEKEIEAHMKDK